MEIYEMRYSLIWMFLLTVAVPVGEIGTVSAGEALAEDKIRVLLITGGHGFEEKPFYALIGAIPDVTYTTAAYPAGAELLRPELAKDYDVIVFYDMWAKGIREGIDRAHAEASQ